ncbi:MAG: hypothetical protein QM796_18825 [Chthoniobacteraceae bacterium]
MLVSKPCEEVTAIEANQETFNLLQKNALLNVGTNCDLHNIAVSDKAEALDFLASTANSGGSKQRPIVNGSEILALKGMPHLLEQTRVFTVEFIPHHLRDMSGASGNV